MSSHKKIEQFLTKKQKQNCPFLYWIQMKTSSRIRHSSKRETLEKNWARSIRNCKPQSHQKKKKEELHKSWHTYWYCHYHLTSRVDSWTHFVGNLIFPFVSMLYTSTLVGWFRNKYVKHGFFGSWVLSSGPLACQEGSTPCTLPPALLIFVNFQKESYSYAPGRSGSWSFFLCFPHNWMIGAHQHAPTLPLG
jgi:ribosomal protein L39E